MRWPPWLAGRRPGLAVPPPPPPLPAAAVPARTLGVRAEQIVIADAHVDARVLHDVLVDAGVGVAGQDIAVTLGTPRLVASTLAPSADGAVLDREDRIEVTVSIVTRERLALFVDAIAGATVDAATLTLTPRAPAAPDAQGGGGPS